MNIFTYKEIKSIDILHRRFIKRITKKRKKKYFSFLEKFDCKYNLYLIVDVLFLTFWFLNIWIVFIYFHKIVIIIKYERMKYTTESLKE